MMWERQPGYPGARRVTSSASRRQLYRAVLERCFERVRQAVRSGRERALASREPPEVVLAGAVGEYFDFIAWPIRSSSG